MGEGADLNPDKTLLVYTEMTEQGSNVPWTIKIYNVSSHSTFTIQTANALWSAYFNKQSKVLFIDYRDGGLKQMDPNGSNIALVAAPLPPYKFTQFFLAQKHL
jgi:hypothetical protein